MEQEHLGQLEMLAGPGVQSLLQSQEVTEDHLDDPDPKMRIAALVLMTVHSGPTEQFKRKCEAMAFQDPDRSVRSAAIGSLGTCFSSTGDRRVERLLAGVVCKETEDYRIRRSAYMSLFLVNGVPPPPGELLVNL